jgi:hypothetical protein
MEQQNKSDDISKQEMDLKQEQMDEPIISAISCEDDVIDNEGDEDDEEEYDYNEQQSDCSSDMGSENQKVPIDLSDNDFYKGICTLLEDDHGNNILEYISLLHTELIGVNKNLRSMNKNMTKIASCAELIAKKKV